MYDFRTEACVFEESCMFDDEEVEPKNKKLEKQKQIRKQVGLLFFLVKLLKVFTSSMVIVEIYITMSIAMDHNQMTENCHNNQICM